jgi:hypothetical protein
MLSDEEVLTRSAKRPRLSLGLTSLFAQQLEFDVFLPRFDDAEASTALFSLRSLALVKAVCAVPISCDQTSLKREYIT